MRIVEYTANADDILEFTSQGARPGNLPRADGLIIPKTLPGDRTWTRGGGVYAVFFDDALVYAGKYRGKENVQVTSFSRPFDERPVGLAWKALERAVRL